MHLKKIALSIPPKFKIKKQLFLPWLIISQAIEVRTWQVPIPTFANDDMPYWGGKRNQMNGTTRKAQTVFTGQIACQTARSVGK